MSSTINITRIIVFFILKFIFAIQLSSQVRIFVNKTDIGVENERLSVVFDKKTGELNSLLNKTKNDNYIKKSNGGNLFRLYVDTKSMPDLISGAHNDNYGGLIIEPSNCKLLSYSTSDNDSSGVVFLTYVHEKSSLEIELEIFLSIDTDWIDSHLKVKNNGGKSISVYAAFPYLSGICLGSDSNTNLAVNMWDRGYPGMRAWEKNSGGVYGRDVSMQWQCVYDPDIQEGLSFIPMDTAFSNKILTCFSEGGMSSLYFDKKIINSRGVQTWPSARIQIFNGNWRTAAREYNNWFSNNISKRLIPNWYKEEITSRSSTWIPSKKQIVENKKFKNHTYFTSFNQLHHLFKHDYNSILWGVYSDCLEFAMWNEGVNLWPETYGPWMSSGFIDFRSDLGGIDDFKEGVKNCHKYGKKVAVYVAGYGARKNSPLFEGNWLKYAIMDDSGSPHMDYRHGDKVYGAFNCPGYKPWQDNLIRVCSMLAEAGVDEIRLDEFGFPFRPCFNPVHSHESPFDCNKWIRTLLKRIREATDKINPDLFISTEFFMDYFHENTNGALVMGSSGKEIDAMKIAMPEYLPLSYHPSASEAAIVGAIMNKTSSQRNNWPWAHACAQKPKDYRENFDIELLWHELHPTFKDAVTYGDISEWDPYAPNDSKWMGHLYKTDDYWVLTGGRVDATPLTAGRVTVKIPETMPENINFAYEFNLITLEMKEIDLQRAVKENYITLTSPVSAVFFPFSSCPPLPIIKQDRKNFNNGEVMKVLVSLFAPWREKFEADNSNSINLIAPGFEVTSRVQENEIVYYVNIPKNIESNNYHFSVTGNCLDAKRWFTINSK